MSKDREVKTLMQEIFYFCLAQKKLQNNELDASRKGIGKCSG